MLVLEPTEGMNIWWCTILKKKALLIFLPKSRAASLVPSSNDPAVVRAKEHIH